MKNWRVIRERYLQDDVPVRLGGLAANLRRIKSFAAQEKHRDVVASLIDESKHFIEWTAAEAEINTAAELVELQVQLAHWQCRWPTLWGDATQRQQLADQSLQWSERILDLSGLAGA